MRWSSAHCAGAPKESALRYVRASRSQPSDLAARLIKLQGPDVICPPPLVRAGSELRVGLRLEREGCVAKGRDRVDLEQRQGPQHVKAQDEGGGDPQRRSTEQRQGTRDGQEHPERDAHG